VQVCQRFIEGPPIMVNDTHTRRRRRRRLKVQVLHSSRQMPYTSALFVAGLEDLLSLPQWRS